VRRLISRWRTAKGLPWSGEVPCFANSALFWALMSFATDVPAYLHEARGMLAARDGFVPLRDESETSGERFDPLRTLIRIIPSGIWRLSIGIGFSPRRWHVIGVLKYGGIAVACGMIAALSSLILFLCSTWFVDMPLRTIVLTALSLCGSGVAALIEFPDRHRSKIAPAPPRTSDIPHTSAALLVNDG